MLRYLGPIPASRGGSAALWDVYGSELGPIHSPACAPGAHPLGLLPLAWVMLRYLGPIPASRGGSAALLNGHPVVGAPFRRSRVRFAPPVEPMTTPKHHVRW